MQNLTPRRAALLAFAGLAGSLFANPAASACEQTLELLRVLQPSSKEPLGKPSLAALLQQHIEAQIQALGCTVSLVDVPRARQLQSFLKQQTDFFYPASRAAERDAAGDFVPMYRTRPLLLSRQALPAAVQDVSSLLSTRLRIVSVRGFSYDGATLALEQRLKAQRRWLLEAEVSGLLRAVRDGVADAALISPPLLIGIPEISQQWHWRVLTELEWREIGVYLSKRVPLALRTRLRERLQESHPALRERVKRDAAPELLSAQYLAFL